MKRNVNHATYQNIKSTFEVFCKEIRNVVQHHFGNHKECGDWCKMVQLRKCEIAFIKVEMEEMKATYHNKNGTNFNKQVYADITKAQKLFTTNKALKEIFHGNNIQKNEAMMHIVINYIPKGTYFCWTICREERVMIACTINSVGMGQFYVRLYAKLRIKMQQPTKDFVRELTK